MKMLGLAIMVAFLSGCSITLPAEWFDPVHRGQEAIGGYPDRYETDPLASVRAQYRDASSPVSRIMVDHSSGSPKIAAVTILNEAGRELLSRSGCPACHAK